MDIMSIKTVELDESTPAVVILDQTCLPNEVRYLSLTKAEEIWDAIYRLKVRGAPAIGVAAACGLYVLACGMPREGYESFYREFKKQKEYLDSSRPTAVNLSWALGRMEKVVTENCTLPVPKILELLLQQARDIRDDDARVCRAIGEMGLSLIKPGDGILTHCNAGHLATSRYGTATAPIYLAQEKGYGLKVYADETRPLLQGARLTAFELNSAGVDVTLLCDNMAASLMKAGRIQAVFVGCDRVAANGDTANKIGTLGVAVIAKRYGVPFYVCAPTSTIDMSTSCGDDIVIEQRPGAEVTSMWYEKPMAPSGVKVYNPAFDVTDGELITGIITERGIARAPYAGSLKRIMDLRPEK